jgi:anti-sigma B factor antagonist
VRLDLAGISFMDSTGLHVLLSSQRRASLLGTDFGLAEPSPTVRRLLQVSGVEGLLSVASEPSTADSRP